MLLHTQTTQILSHLSGFELGADCVVVDAVVVLMTGGDSCFLEVSVNDEWAGVGGGDLASRWTHLL